MPLKKAYTAYFCHDSAQQLRNISVEVPFTCFVTTLNDTCKRELAQEDEGYESGSKHLSISTPLRQAPQIYHVSMNKNLSFDPTTPLTRDE